MATTEAGLRTNPDAEAALARSIESFRGYEPPPGTDAIIERAREFRTFLAD